MQLSFSRSVLPGAVFPHARRNYCKQVCLLVRARRAHRPPNREPLHTAEGPAHVFSADGRATHECNAVADFVRGFVKDALVTPGEASRSQPRSGGAFGALRPCDFNSHGELVFQTCVLGKTVKGPPRRSAAGADASMENKNAGNNACTTFGAASRGGAATQGRPSPGEPAGDHPRNGSAPTG